MALEFRESDKVSQAVEQNPGVTIFLRPIAPPAALGLAGFAGSTFITASWIAEWWGNSRSPTIFFPFVAFWGGLAQFIAGLFGYIARDTLVTVINCLWGSFWMSIGLLYFLIAANILPNHSVTTHFPELASWFIVLTFFTWAGAIASLARDVMFAGTLFFLAIGSTIGCCLYAYGDPSVRYGIKAAAYFWIFSAICAFWRVANYLIEEAYGPNHIVSKFFPIFKLPIEKEKLIVAPGLGEPGVKRAMPGAV